MKIASPIRASSRVTILDFRFGFNKQAFVDLKLKIVNQKS